MSKKTKKRVTTAWNAEERSGSERRVRKELTEWLDAHEWHHWITLTFRSRVGEETAERFVRAWLRHLDRAAQRSVGSFAAKEEGGVAGRTHFHLLVCGTELLKPSVLAKSWRHGRSKVERYTRSGGATGYIVKGLSHDKAEFSISGKLIPRGQLRTKGE